MKLNRLFAVMRKEIIHIKRDKVSLVISFIMPLTMLLLFGYAVATEVDHIPMAVLDLSNSYESRKYIQAFQNSLYFNPDVYVENVGELNRLLDEGKVRAGLIIPPDFSHYKEKVVKPFLKI
ncbi:MAG: ABC transporter permease, partial [Caldanaerobacter sp.]